MLLFVNGCVRENSRTLDLAKAVLAKETQEIEEVSLYADGPEGLTPETLRLREELIQKKEFDHPIFRYATQFAKADTIVVAAPYWDLMFPTRVRAYFEAVTVVGVTVRYSPEGIPMGLCRASRLIYVTTAGGPIEHNFGFDYVDALAKGFYGIPNTRLVKAEGLDLMGADPAAILDAVKREL